MITILPNFTEADIKRMLEPFEKKLEEAILSRLQLVGEKFVANARNKGTYNDQTGNLRNSIGYVVLKDGKQLYDNFQKAAKIKKTITRGKNKGKVKITSGSSDGLNEARKMVEEEKTRFSNGFVLIVVAGMDYAYAVESGHRKTTTGYEYSVWPKDVLTASSRLAAEDLTKALQSLQFAIK